MNDFTPWSALAGGLLIGSAAVWLMASTGRIAGISGIASGSVFAEPGERGWRLSFLAGLLVAWPVYTLVTGSAPPFVSDASPVLAAAAGVLVGVGTQLGSGCTSGHGVCGIARLSPRSLLATATFMATGIATVALVAAIGGPAGGAS